MTMRRINGSIRPLSPNAQASVHPIGFGRGLAKRPHLDRRASNGSLFSWTPRVMEPVRLLKLPLTPLNIGTNDINGPCRSSGSTRRLDGVMGRVFAFRLMRLCERRGTQRR